MNYKEEIINSVINSLARYAESEMLDMVQDALRISLAGYNVEKATTDLQVYDGGYESALKKYIVCKQISGASIKTLDRYYTICKRMLEAIGKPVADITTDDIRVYMAMLRKSGRISNRTLDGMRLCYNGFFKWAASEGLIQADPMLPIQRIKYKKQIKKPFTSVELEKIKRACSSDRDLALVQFLASTGVRVSECSSIDINDVDFEAMELTVLGKGNKERKVYISDVCAMHLKRYISSRNDAEDALFTGRHGRLSKAGIECMLRRISERSGVPDVHPHRFRRTLATSLLNKGMDIVAVAEILGHTDIRTTQIYVSVSQSNVKYAYNKIVAA